MDNQFKHPFHEILKLLQVMTADAPKKISGIALKEFKENFTRQGTRSGAGVDKWEALHQPEPKNREGRNILIKTGRLRRGLRARPDATHARVINDVPYAQAHNEGSHETVTVKPFTRRNARTGKVSQVNAFSRTNNLPARPIMKTTKGLLDDINKYAKDTITGIFARFGIGVKVNS